MVTTNKEAMITLENGFRILQENPNSGAGIEMLKTFAESQFHYQFSIDVIHAEPTSALFIMSVIPDNSTIEKIIGEIQKNNSKVIGQLWRKTKVWRIEIDDRILDPHKMKLTERELAAIFCHEIGHIVTSNSIPTRITNILQYEVAKASISHRAMIGSKVFQTFLSLPILNACMMEKNDSIKEEIKADEFVKKVGYQKDLISVMQKFQKLPEYKERQNADTDMKNAVSFTKDALEQFKQRETTMLESTLLRMIDETPSEIMKESVSSIYNNFFMNDTNDDSSMTPESKKTFWFEYVDGLTDEFIATEFFGLGKTLNRIDPVEIEYIAVKMKDIETSDDKMMLLAYAHNKLDMVNYYLSIMNNPKASKKYRIPHDRAELENFKATLTSLINDIIAYKIPKKTPLIYVKCPEGYEG